MGDESVHDGGSVIHGVVRDSHAPSRRIVRDVVLALVVLFVLVGAFGVSDADGAETLVVDDVSITIDSPWSTRAGNAIEYAILVESDAPLPENLHVEVDAGALELFDDVTTGPEADRQWAGPAGDVGFDFELPPDSRSATVVVRGTAADDWHPSAAGTVLVAVGDRDPVPFTVHTWRFP